ncbi:MAG: Mu-like prophage major head subunit gpT family protein [Planctomycetota bacterium]
MDVTATSINALFEGLKAAFDGAVESTPTEDIDRLMETVPSETGTEQYPVGVLLGDLEEVIDEVTVTQIGAWIQDVANKTFARIVEVRRTHIADDSIGVYRTAVQQLARRATRYPIKLAAQVLLDGFTDTWVDGATVYSDSHEWVGGESWDNLHSLALSATNFETVMEAMETMAGPDGNPLGLSPDLLVVGPANRAAAEDILKVQYDSNGASNKHYERTDLVVLTEWGSDESWLLMDTDPVKPLIWQNREGPDFESDTDDTSQSAMYRERYPYKGRRRGRAAILAPWLIQASDGG